MKRLACLLCIFTMMLSACFIWSGCSSKNPEPVEGRYYSLQDFSDIVPGQSGIADLLLIGPCEMLVMSYGALCVYPTADGKYIKVKLLGDTGELIVHSIDCANTP